jgi:hypothetical protein
MKDFLYVFAKLDKDFDSSITMDEFERGFGKNLGPAQIERIFWDAEKGTYREMNLE